MSAFAELAVQLKDELLIKGWRVPKIGNVADERVVAPFRPYSKCPMLINRSPGVPPRAVTAIVADVLAERVWMELTRLSDEESR